MEEKASPPKVAVLVTDGFEQSEFEKPVQALIDAHIILDVVSPLHGKVRGWTDKNWGAEFEITKTLEEAKADDYDALVLPGGVINADQLRMNKEAIAFVTGFCMKHKPIAAICHALWILIEAGYVKGKKMTSYPSLKTDLINAGAIWFDEEVIVDNGLVTSRNADDLPAFCRKMVEEINEGIHST